MIALVTGVAGFIGSAVADELLRRGWDVRGVDCFTTYYERHFKERNLSNARRSRKFSFVEADLLSCDLNSLLQDSHVIFHLAGQPGVRPSWGPDFQTYLDLNVLVTQRLLEASRNAQRIRAFINSSSSSVYGDQHDLPVTEQHLPQPTSPYGVSKLAAEHLCSLYRSQFDIPVVSLRYFTVYGPRQRPDMAIHRLISAAYTDSTFTLNGDGNQRRDFTFIEDVVDANLRTMSALLEERLLDSFYNVGCGGTVGMNDLIEKISSMAGRKIRIANVEAAPGDPGVTFSDSTKLQVATGWRPHFGLDEGLEAQLRSLV